MDNAPTHLYVGLRAAVMAEVGTPGFYAGKYLVAPFSTKADHPADGCHSKAEVAATVKWWRKEVPGIRVIFL